MPKSLYICYFGLREPLVQTQVVPYLRELAKGGNDVSLLTFEPERHKRWTSEETEAEKQRLAKDGISWHALTYHKWPSVPATFFDIMNGAFFVWRFCRKHRPDILHGRAHVATLPAAIARKFLRRKPKLLFDIRGFLPEEYTEGGIWPPGGYLFRALKSVERWLLRDGDGFVVLTEKARSILFPGSEKTGMDRSGRPVEVIPCCVDTKRFENVDPSVRDSKRKELGMDGRKVFVYVGSFGSDWYLPRETADILSEARERDRSTFAMFLSQTSPDHILPLLTSRGFTESDVMIRKIPPAEMPEYLSAADVAISFIKPCYSKLASSPTKNAEYLATGLPLICNDGVGDTGEFTRADNVGFVIEEFSHESYRQALTEVDEMLSTKEELSERCQESARTRFDLETVGGMRYRRLYGKLQS